MEQFSICSNDSIWEDEERRNEYIHSKIVLKRNVDNAMQPMYFNGFVRFDQTTYVNPAYKNNDSDRNDNLSQSNVDTKCDANDQYQVER